MQRFVAIKIVVANCSVLHNLKRSNPKGKIEFSKIGNLGDLCVTKIPLLTTRIVLWLNHVCYPGTYWSSVAYGVESSLKYVWKFFFEVIKLNWLQNIYWIDHTTLERVYGGLTPLSLRPKEKRLQFAGHFYRADKGSSLLLWRAPWVGRVQSSELYSDGELWCLGRGLHENSVHCCGRRMMMMMRIATEVAGGNVRGKGIHWLTCIYNNLKIYAHVLLWVVGFSRCPVWEAVEIKLFKIFRLVVRSKEGLTCIRNLRKGKPRRR